MNADKNFRDNANLLQHQTEEAIIQAIQLSDTSFKLLDDSLNKQMNEGLSVLYQEYDRVGKDPSRIDLESIKQRLGGSEELYIINESGVIEYTTYTPDSRS
jgi:hypothetical protein